MAARCDSSVRAGRVAAAESCFALAVARGDDPGAFIEYGKFLRRVGRLSQSQEMFERALKFAQDRQDASVVRLDVGQADSLP